MKKLIRNIKGKTPRCDKISGQFSTVIGIVSLAILGSVEIENTYLKSALIVLSILCGGKSVYHAQKTEK